MPSALLAITLLSLLVAGGSLAVAFYCLREMRLYRETALTEMEEVNANAHQYRLQWREAEDYATILKAQLAAAERRARSRESKYSRRQPETPAPLPENADA